MNLKFIVQQNRQNFFKIVLSESVAVPTSKK
jgi:hypothetical protein